jgi:hypothetical protein
MRRRIFIYFFSVLLLTILSFSGFEKSVAQQTPILQHYTDAAGFQAIQKSQLILADSKGRVFLTPNEYSQAEAFYALFIGNPAYKDKGTHVFRLQMRPGLAVRPGTQPNEVIFEGTLRFGKHADVLYAGLNPKK